MLVKYDVFILRYLRVRVPKVQVIDVTLTSHRSQRDRNNPPPRVLSLSLHWMHLARSIEMTFRGNLAFDREQSLHSLFSLVVIGIRHRSILRIVLRDRMHEAGVQLHIMSILYRECNSLELRMSLRLKQ
jgi:hypothetical protein